MTWSRTMMMMRMEVSVFLMMFLWILTVSRGDPEVSCVFMETCILPCSFHVNPQVIIHWIQLKGLHVHFFSNNQDQLGHQHQSYRNRTSLFKDQISRGNASLQLTGVKVQDEGRYRCFTRSSNGINESVINLKVDAPVHKVNIQKVENRISCSSEGIYPEPELTWSTTPPSNISLHNTSTVQEPEQQLYSITSSLVLSDDDTDLVYSCTVKTRRNKMTAILSKTINVEGIKLMMGPYTWALIVPAAAAVAAAVGLRLFCKKKTGQMENNKRRSNIDETMCINAETP